MVLRMCSSVHVSYLDADLISVSSATVAIHHLPALLQLVSWITATAISDAAIAGYTWFLQSNESLSMVDELPVNVRGLHFSLGNEFYVMISSVFRRNGLGVSLE